MALVHLEPIADITKAAIQFVKFIQEEIRDIKTKQKEKLDRLEIIRAILHQCRGTFPDYNAVIAEQQCANFFIDSKDKLIDESVERQDRDQNFLFRLVVFKNGSVSITKGLYDGNRWGIIHTYLKINFNLSLNSWITFYRMCW